MTKNFYRLAALGVALSSVLGCNGAAAPSASLRSRDFKSYTEPDGRRHPIKADIHAGGTIACTKAAGQGGDLACYIETTAGGYQVVKAGSSIPTGGDGTMIMVCQGTGALTCFATIKD